jgi:hypothetical protein
MGSFSRRRFVKISVKLAIFTLATVALQFGLAVLGWGGFAAFFSHPPLVAVAIVTVVLTFVAFFSAGNLSAGEQEDRGNRWVLVAFGVLMILIAFLPAYTDRKNLFTLRWLPTAFTASSAIQAIWECLSARWVGLLLFVPGPVCCWRRF